MSFVESGPVRPSGDLIREKARKINDKYYDRMNKTSSRSLTIQFDEQRKSELKQLYDSYGMSYGCPTIE